MKSIQATEVRSRWFELLRSVEAGEEIAITRYGKAIARLVPADPDSGLERKRAIEEFLRRRDEGPKIRATLEEILSWRHEGHRF